MVLVDTVVWVHHLRFGNLHLKELLLEGEVTCHPFIVGELACGQLKNRQEILSLLQELPVVEPIENEEILQFIENHHLMGIGLGYIDMHLLASARLTHTALWTVDKKLKEVSSRLNVKYE